MASPGLSIQGITLRIIEVSKLSKHEDVHLSYSFATNSLLLKQIPELDSSGVHIAYRICNSNLLYQDDTIDEGGAATVHLETKAPIQAQIILPETERVNNTHEHEVTVGMFCTISTEVVPVNSKVHIIVDGDESREKINLLVTVLRQSTSSIRDLLSDPSLGAELSHTMLELSEEELDFLNKCGAQPKDQTAPIKAADPAAQRPCFWNRLQNNTEARAEANSNHARNNVGGGGPCPGSNVYKLTSNGNIQQPARGAMRLTMQSYPQRRRLLSASETKEYEGREAQRQEHCMQVKDFFSEGKPTQGGKSRALHSTTNLRNPISEVTTKHWQAFATANSDSQKRLLSNVKPPMSSHRINDTSQVGHTNLLLSSRGRIIQPPQPPLSNEEILASLHRSENHMLARTNGNDQTLGGGHTLNEVNDGDEQDSSEQNEYTNFG